MMARDIPDVVKGFQGLVEKSLSPGALDTKVKEFVALGIAVAQHCVPCIFLHTRKRQLLQAPIKKKSWRQQVLGSASASGPGFTHVADVIKALDAMNVA